MLYAVAYTLKMSYKTDYKIKGFFEYVVPPLEGFWWQDKEGVTEEWFNSKAKTARKYSTVFYRGITDEELDLSGVSKSSRITFR